MNIRFTYTVLRGALLGVVLVLTACVNTLELATPNGRNRSQDREQAIREAVAYFDNHRALLTRSAEAEPTEEAPFVVGDIVVDWESAVAVSNDEKRYTDFTMRKENRFYLLLGQEGEQWEAVELYSRFASVEDFGLDTMNQYVATYIPDVEYLQSYYAVAQDYGINCAEWYEFSGVVLYTMLSGHHIAAYRYDGGTITERAFLYDREQTDEENIADFCSVMEGLTLGVATQQDDTRVVVDNEDKPVKIEEIIIYDKKFPTIFKPQIIGEEDDDNQIVEPTIIGITLPLIGGGGGSTEKEKEELTAEKFTKKILKNTLNPTDSAQLHSMLSEIIKDCMGNTLLQEIYRKNIPIEIHFIQPSNTQNNSQYKRSRNINNCGIFMVNNHSEGLVHELFHFYQHFCSDYDSFTNAEVNYEIEAHMLTILYMSHTSNSNANSRYNSYCNTALGGYIDLCTEFINADVTFYGKDNATIENSKSLFDDYFDEAAWFYKNKNQSKIYDTNRAASSNISNLQLLFKDCD